MSSTIPCCCSIIVTMALSAATLGQISIPTVFVGNPGNAADPTTGYGSVAYTYNIGTYEVTNAQYAAFLNAKAASDPFNLYNTAMGNVNWFGGITRSGSPGSYTYAPVEGRENNPVLFVPFWGATRFANWLHNGQGNGDTETGAYTLTADGTANNTISRNAGWRWAVTSEDEWYKAAYHQPASAGGDADDYWLYPTSSNSISPWQANYGNLIGNTTPVGSYTANHYGTFDMAGNAYEWNEAIIFNSDSSFRGLRGGSYFYNVNYLRADFRYSSPSSNVSDNIGFRVVTSLVTPPPPPCYGDANGDNVVNGADLSFLLGVFGSTVANFPAAAGADFNGDGVINAADLSVLLANFGRTCD